MIHRIGIARNKIEVFVDLINSNAAKSIARQPHLLTLAAEALKKVSLRGPEVSVEYDVGRTIGYDYIIETTDANTIFYAQANGDDLFTRYTKNGKPEATQHITLILQRETGDSTYQLHDIHIGLKKPPKLGSTQETSESKAYWYNHAVLFNGQSIQPRTITKVHPLAAV